MKKTVNKPLLGSTNKFYNVYKSEKENKYFFILPTFGSSRKKNLNWDMTIKSYFFAWGYFFIQFNVCEVVKDNSLELTKECFESLKIALKSVGLVINDLQAVLIFIKNNIHIVQIIRNANLDHPYSRKLLLSYFQNQPFVSQVN